MSLTLEASNKEEPIILIYGNNALIPLLFDEYSKEFKIAYVGSIETSAKRENFYRIPQTNAEFLKNIEEKIDYALLFLEGQEDKSLTPAFFEKIKNDGTHTAVIINIENVQDFYDILLEYKDIPTVQFFLLGDLYSEGSEFKKSNTSAIISRAISGKTITLSENLESIFPIYYKDAISGINQILFGPKKKEKLYYLFYKEPQTVNALAHVIRRFEPDLEVNYKEAEEDARKTFEEITREIKSKVLVFPVFLDKYFIGLEKTLSLFERNRVSEDNQEKKEIIILSKNVPQKPHFKALVLSVVISLFLFIVLNIGMIALSLFQLKTSVQAFKEGDYKKASSNIRSASSFLSLAEPVAILGSKIAGSDFNQVQESVALMHIASNNFDSLEKVTKGLDRETLEKIISDGIYFYFRFQELKNEVSSETLNTFSTLDLPNIISLSQTLPAILGYEEEKNYLLLFQNNGELRPTGGFIGSVGELKLSSGKIESLTIQDVYEYDGKLKAHVEPHYIIRRYLQPHLYLRDSNFNPDFQISASTSALLYNLETEKKIDGVIAINFEAVRRLIEEIGPIELPAYKKTLDGKNTFDFLQTTIDDNFFPGSTQKKDVLTTLFNQIILKLEDQNSAISAARLLPKLMDEKHVLFAFNSSSIQSIFNNLGYGGTFSDKRNIEVGRINDFLSINEANIGVNKANIKVGRSTNYEVTIGNKIESRILHALANDSDKEYKAYIRVFTPLGSKLTSISFDEQKQNITSAVTDFKTYERAGFKAPSGLEVDQTIDQHSEAFGFVLSIAPKSTKKIEITYDNGLILGNESIVTYSLSLIKQPGTGKYPFTLRLSYGDNFVPKEVENATLEKDSIVIERELLEDEIFDVRLIKR